MQNINKLEQIQIENITNNENSSNEGNIFNIENLIVKEYLKKILPVFKT